MKLENKYINIYNEIKEKIILKEYKKNQKLPSKRVMADRMGCSVITVAHAYDMLLDEGFIYSKERSGYFVSELDDIFPIKKEVNIQISHLDESVEIDTSSAFEYSLWFKTVRKVMSEKDRELFVKSPNKGCAVLRNAISDYLLRYRGMVAPPEQIIIGSGAEQLYESVVNILGRNKVFGIENPSYSRIEAVYSANGVKIKKLKMQNDGIKTEELINNKIDVLHVTPFKSYPTNITTTINKKYEYLKWATDNKYIVEDDFNSEFFIPGNPVKSLYSLDLKNRVIYINTFSKSLSPAMRIGYMILPKELLPIYDKKLGEFSCSVPVFDQYVLAEFLNCGAFERHLNRMRRHNK